MKLAILLISILLMGCSIYKEVIDEEPQMIIEKEVIKEKIVYIDRNITIPCNVTCSEEDVELMNKFSSDRELELIRRLKFLEGQTDKYFNDTECRDELNETNVKLEDCEEELCDEWNSSWC